MEEVDSDSDFDFTFTQEEFDRVVRDAEHGDARAKFTLSDFWQLDGVINREHVRMMRKAAEDGFVTVQYALADCLASEYWAENDWAEVVHWYQCAADNGCAKALYALACCYYHGKGVPSDRKEADRLCLLAAEKGCGGAQLQMAENLFDADRQAALFWYRKAANAGCDGALYALARCYEVGDGVEQNIDEAVSYAAKVVEHDILRVRQDTARDALKLLIRCVKRGNVQAQMILGDYYSSNVLGLAVLTELGRTQRLKSAYCYRKAAAQGSKVAADKFREIVESFGRNGQSPACGTGSSSLG